MTRLLRLPAAALLVLAVDFCLLIAFAIIGWNLRLIDNAIDIWFDKSDPLIGVYEYQTDTFGNDSWIYVNIWTEQIDPPEATQLSRDLTQSFRQLDGIASVLSPSELDVLQEDSEGLYYDVLSPEMTWAEMRESLEIHPIASRLLLDDDSARLGFLLEETTEPGTGGDQRQDLVSAIRSILSKAPGITQFTVTGSAVLNADLNRLSWRDFQILIPLTGFVMSVLAAAILRREWRFGVVVIAIAGLAMMSGSSAMILAAFPFNMVTIALPGVLFTLGVASGFHVYQHIAVRMPELRDLPLAEQASRVQSALFRPIAVSHVTTALGFGLLSMITVQPVQSMAFWGAFGVLWVGLHTLLVLPPLVLAAGTPKLLPEWGVSRVVPHYFRALEKAVGRPGLLIAILLVSVAVCVVLISSVRVDSTYLTMVDKKEPLRRDYARLEQADVAGAQLSLLFQLDRDDAAVPVEFNQALARLDRQLLAIGPVVKVIGPSEIYTETAEKLKGDRPRLQVDQDPDFVTDAYIFALTGGNREVPRYLGDDFTNFRMVVLFEYLTNRELQNLVNLQIAPLLREIEQELPYVSAQTSGLTVLWANMDAAILQGQIKTLLILGFACLALFWVSTRSLRLAIIATAINLMPIAVIAATMGMLGTSLDLAAVFILSLSLGIAIDDTSYFIHRYCSLKKQGNSMSALRTTWAEITPTMLMTSVLIASGFAVLLLSSFTPMQVFGGLTAVGVALAALFDIFILPLLISIRSSTEGDRS